MRDSESRHGAEDGGALEELALITIELGGTLRRLRRPARCDNNPGTGAQAAYAYDYAYAYEVNTSDLWV